MARYSKQHELRKQSMFLPGPVDPATGNFTPSEAQRQGVQQWPKSQPEREKQHKFFRRAGLGY